MNQRLLNIRIPPDQTDPEDWERWFYAEGIHLGEFGIPESILKDKYLWRDFFANGRMEYSGHSDFSVNDIPAKHLINFKMVLETSFPETVLGEVALYIVLCRRLGIDPTPR